MHVHVRVHVHVCVHVHVHVHVYVHVHVHVHVFIVHVHEHVFKFQKGPRMSQQRPLGSYCFSFFRFLCISALHKKRKNEKQYDPSGRRCDIRAPFKIRTCACACACACACFILFFCVAHYLFSFCSMYAYS